MNRNKAREIAEETTKAFLHGHPTAFAAAKTAWIVGRYLFGRLYDEDLRAFASIDGLVLDIGANSGQSALSLAIVNRHCSILSFEPVAECARDLVISKRLLGRRFDFQMRAVADYSGVLTLTIPMKGNTLLTQEATHDASELGSSESRRRLGTIDGTRAITVPCVRIDDLSLSPAGVKVDCQGAEAFIIRGMLETIDRSRPLIMTENSHVTQHVAAMLSPFGYSLYSWNDGFTAANGATSTANVFWLTEAHRCALSR